VRIAGPLAVFADGFRGELERGGYSRSTVEAQPQLMAHVSGWLDSRVMGAGDLTDARVAEYLAYRRACGRTHRCSSRALDALLGFLRGLDVAPGSRPAPIVTPSDRLLAEFEQYLLRDRGLVELTVQSYAILTVLARPGLRAGELAGLQLDDSAYARVRQQLCPTPKQPSFFVSTLGTRVLYECVFETFTKLRAHTPGRQSPRPRGRFPRARALRPRCVRGGSPSPRSRRPSLCRWGTHRAPRRRQVLPEGDHGALWTLRGEEDACEAGLCTEHRQ
jgi:integrase